MSRDDIDHIPSIVPSRDHESVAMPAAGNRKRGAGKPSRGGSSRRGGTKPAGSGAGPLARILITVSLVVAAVACAWAWQLQEQLRQASYEVEGHESRIADLEARLSDTDEGMSQNAAVQAAKLKELDSEVRKLWDNVWKQSKARLAALEATDKSLKSVEGKLSGAESDLAKLKNVAGDLSRLMTNAKNNQAEVERVADTLNRINLDLAKLNRSVKANEEGIRATDAFRRQVNASISDLEAAIRILQNAP